MDEKRDYKLRLIASADRPSGAADRSAMIHRNWPCNRASPTLWKRRVDPTYLEGQPPASAKPTARRGRPDLLRAKIESDRPGLSRRSLGEGGRLSHQPIERACQTRTRRTPISTLRSPKPSLRDLRGRSPRPELDRLPACEASSGGSPRLDCSRPRTGSPKPFASPNHTLLCGRPNPAT